METSTFSSELFCSSSFSEAPILKLSQELEKLQYPFLEENLQKIIKENTSHLPPKPKRKLYRYLEDGE
jgi:hypothetical protein